jgi:hypothetical protein
MVAKAALTCSAGNGLGGAGQPGAAAGDGSSSIQDRGVAAIPQGNGAQQPSQQQQQQRGSPLCSRQGSFNKQQQQTAAAASGPRSDKSSSSGSLRAVVGAHVMGSSPVQQQQHPTLQMAECS